MPMDSPNVRTLLNHTAWSIRICRSIEHIGIAASIISTSHKTRVVTRFGVVSSLEDVAWYVEPLEVATGVTAGRVQEAGDAAFIGIGGLGNLGGEE